MKIFIAVEFLDDSVTTKFIKDNGSEINLKGIINRHDYYPCVGTTLEEGEEDRLRDWLNLEGE